MAIELEIFEASAREFGKCSEKFNLLSDFHNRLLFTLCNSSDILEIIFLERSKSSSSTFCTLDLLIHTVSYNIYRNI